MNEENEIGRVITESLKRAIMDCGRFTCDIYRPIKITKLDLVRMIDGNSFVCGAATALKDVNARENAGEEVVILLNTLTKEIVVDSWHERFSFGFQVIDQHRLITRHKIDDEQLGNYER